MDHTAGEKHGGFIGGATNCEFACAKELGEHNAIGSHNRDAEDIGWAREGEEPTEDVNGNRQLGVTVPLPNDSFDAAENTLGDGRFNGLKGVTGVSMEQMDSGQVSLDCFWLDTPGQADNPLEDSEVGGWQDVAVAVGERGVKANKFEEGALPG